MTDADDDGRIGYGRPPQHSRFKRGASGNPNGRPKGTVSFKAALLEELSETIPVPQGSGEGRMTKQRAIVKTLVAASLAGDAKVAIALMGLCARLFGTQETDPRAADDDDFVDRLAERERQAAEKINTDPSPSTTEPEK